MSERGSTETAAVILLTIGVAAGIVELFYRPFGVGPVGFLAVLIGSGISSRYRRFGLAATGFVIICFLIGASIAVWDSRSLY